MEGLPKTMIWILAMLDMKIHPQLINTQLCNNSNEFGLQGFSITASLRCQHTTQMETVETTPHAKYLRKVLQDH